MPRKKVTPKRKDINSWEEADEALAEIAVMAEQINKEVSAYNEKEQKRREALTQKHAPLKTKITEIELGLEEFCLSHRDDFGKQKSKELTHGTVSFRFGTPKVKALKGWTQTAILNLLEKISDWKDEFVRVSKTLNKEAVLTAVNQKRISNEGLKEFGMEVVQDETFGYDLKLAVNNK